VTPSRRQRSPTRSAPPISRSCRTRRPGHPGRDRQHREAQPGSGERSTPARGPRTAA
jgi:hypothetical protein